MLYWREWWARAQGLLNRRGTRLDEELQLHLDLLTDDLIAHGLPPAEAHRRARLTLGGAAQIREDYLDQRGIPFFESLWRDTRYAARALRARPGFTTVVLLTMALGIGVNTAVFSVLYSAWLAPFRYAQPRQLVDVSVRNLQNGWQTGGTTWANFTEWRAATDVFSGMGAYLFQREMNLTGAGDPIEIRTARVSSGLLPLVGVAPRLGRAFVESEDRAEGARAAVLSDAFWHTRFHADPAVLGRTLTVEGEPFVIVGVMPPGFAFPAGLPAAYQAPLWLSLNLTAEARAERGAHSLYVVARRRNGVSIEQAQARMAAIVDRLAAAYPRENGGYGALVTPLSETRNVRATRPALLLVMAAAVLVLLIACANVANLLLVRGAARRREFAIRQALGVGRFRLARQVLTESLLFGLLGGAAGLVVAAGALPLITAVLPESMPQAVELRLHPGVLVFSTVCALACGLFFGLLPAWQAGRGSVENALKQSARTITPRSRLARALVVVEMALALILLTAGGLLAESFRRLSSQDFGFDREHILTLRVSLPKARYATAARILDFRRQLLDRARSLPGVVSAGTVHAIPLGIIMSGTDFDVEGHSTEQAPHADFAKTSADYLRTMAIPLRAGRYFNASDTGGERVTIVNESFARRYLGGAALGRRIHIDQADRPDWFRIIGIVGDIRQISADEAPDAAIYVLNEQLGDRAQVNVTARLNVLAVRFTGDPAPLAAALRQALRAIDPEQPVADVLTMEGLIDRNIAGRRLNAVLLSAFSLLAIALAAIGLFGTVSAMVTARTAEIGVRIALGAGPRAVARLVLGEAGGLSAAGLALGTLGALLVARLLPRFLYGTSPADAGVLSTVIAILSLAVLAATAIPLRRALSVDPLSVLRDE